MPETPPPASTGADFLKSARDVAFLTAIYLYFAGWIYMYTYFNFFGVSKTDIEFYYFLVYSVNVMVYLAAHWFLTSCVIILSITAVHFIRHSWVIYVLCTVFFGLLYYSSYVSATEDAKHSFAYDGHLLKVKFVLKEEKAPETKTSPKLQPTTSNNQPSDPGSLAIAPEDIAGKFKKDNEQDKLRLLVSSSEGYLVLVINDFNTYENAVSRDKVVYYVKKENISLIKITK